jgi:hypothetical protein
MLSFFTTIHALPQGTVNGPVLEINSQSLTTLAVPREQLNATTFHCTFEQASASLALLSRMYCEPDGSFVWVSPRDEPAWQVDGNLYDRDQKLLFIDLKGTCPASEFDRLLMAFGWPATQLLFQLTREAVFLDEAQFRRYASSTNARD